MIDAKAIIIGAGVAGIAAACRLLEKGMNDFVILEAENRIGGRIHCVNFCGHTVDLGAHWVHGEKGNVVFAMANQLNLLGETVTTIIEDSTLFVDSGGRTVNPEKAGEIIGIISAIEADSKEALKTFHGSVGDFFTREFQRQIQETESVSEKDIPLANSILNWYSKLEKSIDGSDSWFETSGSGLTEYWDCEGNLLWTWKQGGYENILDILMRKYPDPSQELPLKERLLLNKEVVKIEWDPVASGRRRNVVLRCHDGTCYVTDHVILTTSLGVLKAQADTLFNPPLPAYKLNAIKGLAIGTVNKIFLKFPYRWWPDDCHAFALLWDTEDKNELQREENSGLKWLEEVFMIHDVDHHPLCLCGWIVGPESRKMELLSEREVCNGIMKLLNHFLGKKFNIPQPEKILRTSWGTNPHFRGSYSFRSTETERRGTNAACLAKPITNGDGKQVLLFAGEATHDHYYSTVHGAIETGWREADRILNEIRSFRKSSL